MILSVVGKPSFSTFIEPANVAMIQGKPCMKNNHGLFICLPQLLKILISNALSSLQNYLATPFYIHTTNLAE